MLSTFWSLWVIAIVLGTLVSCGLLIVLTKGGQKHDTETEQTTGHVFDGIEELDNPLPQWWVMMFWGTIVFAVGYIAAYGLANLPGFLTVEVDGEQVAWSQTTQWQNEVQQFEQQIAPLYAGYAKTPIAELAKNEDALQTGQRLFVNNCAVCHGSTATGAQGFPNLTDNDWLHGGSAEKIVETITQGRTGTMPAKGLMPAMSDAQLDNTVQYVRSLSGLGHDADQAAAGAPVFAQACAACHGGDAKGMQLTGAPNLTDDIWLYGGSTKQIEFTVRNGRSGKMPAQQGRLSAEKIHLLGAYVYSLSHKAEAAE